MKTLTILLLTILTSLSSLAQNPNYESGMKSGLEKMKAAKTSNEFMEVANHFERISTIETKEWLPKYWTSFNILMTGIKEEKNEIKDAHYLKALGIVEQLELMENADQSEVQTLKAYLIFMQVPINSMSRGPKYTPIAKAAIEKAKSLNPSNPRPDFVLGQNIMYTPKFFGGGKENALPILLEAKSKYDKEVVTNELLPKWGKPRCEALIETCKK